MPVDRKRYASLAEYDRALKRLPSTVTWSRLEPLSMTTGDLQPGLQTLIGDPLWLMTRQWQFEELRGEDGGSPIRVEVDGAHSRFDRFHPGPLGARPQDAAVDAAGLSVPLEVAVEAEAPPQLPERIRAEAGLHLLRMLRAAGLGHLTKEVVARWAFVAGDAGDTEGTARRRMLAGRVPDAAAVVRDLVPDGDGVLLGFSVGDGDRARVRSVATAWRGWLQSYLAAPVGRSSWNPNRLEYAFAVQATLGDKTVVLRADEYATGTVDWYSFDIATHTSLGAAGAAEATRPIHETVLPAPVRYPGMPADRLWAFEDARVWLGALDAGSTDLARLALIEFALVYGDDWFVIPVDLPAGSVLRIDGLKVRDTFGVETPVKPAREATQPGWTVFQLAGLDADPSLADVFVLPPTVRHVLESPPLEEVALFRDEMANLVWGVERVVQGPSGERIDRARQASPVTLRQQVPGDLGDARLIYRLMTPVPEHWNPMLPVARPALGTTGLVVNLERRPLVRFRADGSAEAVHPQGVLLRVDTATDVATDRLLVAEEEVPRDGVVLTRSYQLARTEDGRTIVWIGRRKRAGRGEGKSGLRFDTALPPVGQ